MENINNGTTPAQAATLPNVPAVVTTPPAVTPAPTGTEGKGTDGKVTIDLKTYNDLQRAKARTLSFDKRAALGKNKQMANIPDGDQDPMLVQELTKANQAREEAERKVMQMEVRDKVKTLLDADEFKALPKSTKELILRNPSMLSEAESLDEAMIDIEEFVRDQVLSMEKVEAPINSGNPTGHQTPPVVNGGSPAQVTPAGLEDLSKLSGTARSQAAIRNKIREQKGVK